MKAEFGLSMGDDQKKPMDKKVLRAVEEAVESFVGDLMGQRR